MGPSPSSISSVSRPYEHTHSKKFTHTHTHAPFLPCLLLSSFSFLQNEMKILNILDLVESRSLNPDPPDHVAQWPSHVTEKRGSGEKEREQTAPSCLLFSHTFPSQCFGRQQTNACSPKGSHSEAHQPFKSCLGRKEAGSGMGVNSVGMGNCLLMKKLDKAALCVGDGQYLGLEAWLWQHLCLGSWPGGMYLVMSSLEHNVQQMTMTFPTPFRKETGIYLQQPELAQRVSGPRTGSGS